MVGPARAGGSYVARTLWREGKAAVRLFRAHVRNRSRYRAVANPYAVRWIDPCRVSHKLAAGWRLRDEPPGTILDGDWDRPLTTVADSDKFQGVVERFDLGIPWEETSLFRKALRKQLDRNGNVRGMRSMEELATYYREHVDGLYRLIEMNGFQPPSLRRRITPAYAYIGRSGEFIWGPGGNHRLAIARVLRLERIPVIVHVRHMSWQRVREMVAADDIVDVSGELLNHPDLLDLLPPSVHVT
jgi:hypothetical protein